MTLRGRPMVVSVLFLVGLATAYSLLIGTLWFLEAHSARSTVSDLSITLEEEQNSFDALSSETEDLASTANANVTTIGRLADDRAQAQDNFILYGFISLGLADCVREREELVDVVKHRYEYYIWSIRSVESDLTAYCQETHSVYAGLVAEDAG